MSALAVVYLALVAAGALLLCRAHVHGVAWAMACSLQDAGGQVFSRRPVIGAHARLARDRIVNYVAGAAVLSSYGLIAQRPASHCIVLAIVGALFAELVSRRADLTRQQKYIRKLEFFIPTVMERVVMAVGAGLDIIPAMKEAAEGADDPASLFLRRVVALTNSGLALEDALESAASGIDCPTLKHLSVHLGLAYRQGGELVRPLRELSDATQLQYQEVEEEEIAKLPVKAVLPLVLTFAGLILCFLTVPLIQVGSIVSKVADVGQQ